MVKYGEGLDRKRSDIFWYNNKLNKDNIIIFFNSIIGIYLNLKLY